MLGKHDVHSASRHDEVHGVFIGHLPHASQCNAPRRNALQHHGNVRSSTCHALCTLRGAPVGKAPRRVDDLLGLDRESLRGLQVLHHGAAELAVLGLGELEHADAVRHGRAALRSRQGNGERHSCVIHLAIVVDHRALEPVCLQHRKAKERLSLVDEVAARHRVGSAR
eukprot:scaffold256_cov261-Pinguiococcus_pyrenoidosus.AAC.54